jgi:hypothetical protein
MPGTSKRKTACVKRARIRIAGVPFGMPDAPDNVAQVGGHDGTGAPTTADRYVGGRVVIAWILIEVDLVGADHPG